MQGKTEAILEKARQERALELAEKGKAAKHRERFEEIRRIIDSQDSISSKLYRIDQLAKDGLAR